MVGFDYIIRSVKQYPALIFFLAMPWAAAGAVQVSSSTVQGSTPSAEVPEPDPTTSTQESEAKDIIPPAAETLTSTQPITPTSIFPEKKPYDQAKDELARAQELWVKGHPEAASDTALEAYDDFLELRRVPGVKRTVIRGQVRQAAGIYVEAGITYIKNWVKRAGGSPMIMEEGRARMEDLRDVARNYSDLNKMLNNAIEQLR